MKRMAKKLAVVLVCGLLLLSAAGCNDGSTETAGKLKLAGVNEFPIVEEPAELTLFIPKPAMISDISTNEFTTWYEEKTGVHINWEIASGDTKQAVNLRIASDDLPDAFLGAGFSAIEVAAYGEQGTFVDISDMIDDNMYYFKDILAKRDDIREKLEVNGAIYGLPKVLESAGQRCLDKMWVYTPWLEKLDMEMPETTEEFYQMLKAFKEQDPNGNGIADEIPLAGRGISSDVGIEDYIMNAFTYSDTRTNRLYVEDGKVLSSATTDGFREGLRYLKKLYDEGLLLQDTFIIDRTRLTAIGENEGVPILGACTGQWPGMFTLSGSDSGRIREYLSIPPLEGPTGLRQTPRTDITSSHGTAFNITSACENPELALRWADWLYSNEGRIAQQGISNYREAKEGEIGLNGQQAKYAYDPLPADDDSATFGMVQNEFWGANFGLSYFDLEMVGSEKLLEGDLNIMLYHEAIDKYFEYVVDKSYPVLPIDTSLAAEYTDLETTIREAIDKAVVAFVTGERNLDTEWDAYLAELEGYGMPRYLEMSQERYDTYRK